jgi:hypothetical protein
MRIGSSHDNTVLELGTVEAPRPASGVEYIHVGLEGPVTAWVRVYDNHFDSLAAFFRDMAYHWRGWIGAKTWESLEGEFALNATTDRTGHIYLRVTLRGDRSATNWCVESTVFLDAGQLDGLAQGVARHISGTAGAA